MAVKAVFFDAAGTLIKPSRPVGESYAAAAQKFGVSISPSEISSRFGACFKSAPPLAFPGERPEKIPTLEFDWWKRLVARIFEPLGHFYDFDDFFMTLFSYFARPESWTLYPEARETLAGLEKRGLMVSVISNFDSRLLPILDGLGVAKHFEHVFISSHIGWAKPAREIFDCALTAHKINPSEAVHVGDNLDADVQGAANAGLDAVFLDRSGMRHVSAPCCIRNLGELLSLIDDQRMAKKSPEQAD
ncbi:MAG TPA: HAD-IA family hydrolase [Candidatus Binatia bacterium]|jgi:putative hydrolase of the HAD superfamily